MPYSSAVIGCHKTVLAVMGSKTGANSLPPLCKVSADTYQDGATDAKDGRSKSTAGLGEPPQKR